jgi:hypothetical protein
LCHSFVDTTGRHGHLGLLAAQVKQIHHVHSVPPWAVSPPELLCWCGNYLLAVDIVLCDRRPGGLVAAYVMPAEVCTFSLTEAGKAREWIAETQ